MVMFLNIRNYLLIFLSLVTTANASIVWSDVSDRFNFKFGDQFSSVIMRMDITNPYGCERGLYSPPHYRIQRMFKKAPFSNFSGLENQDLLFVANDEFDSDCNLVTFQQMGFCRSTGELLMHLIYLPLTHDELVNSMPAFDEGSRNFVGFSKKDELLDYYFSESMIRFSVKNKQKNYLRESYFSFERPDGTDHPYVDHIMIKLPKQANYNLSWQTCPPGPDIISEFRPKYRNLDKLFSTVQRFTAHFRARRQLFNKCSVVFPNSRDRYTVSWTNFQETYQGDLSSLQNKIDQILISIGDSELSDHYEAGLEKAIQTFTMTIKYISQENSYDKERCDRFLGDNAFEVDKVFSNRKYIDLEFAKEYLVVD